MYPVRIWRRARILLAALAVCIPSSALDNSRTLGQFIHTAWSQKEGAPGRIWAISQTKDGYLWLAAHEGLFRFDGITFEHYEPQSGPALPPTAARSLLALPNGDLWIGFRRAISLLRNGRVQNYTGRDGVPDGHVIGLVQDGEGTIWAGTNTGLARFVGNRWEKVGKEWNFSGESVGALFVDRQGTLWVAVPNDSIFFLSRGATAFQSTSVRVGQVAQIAEASNGKLWMAETTRSVRPIPLGVKLPPSDTVEIRVGSEAIFFPREGDLWITTVGDGIRRAPIPEQLSGKPGRFSPAVESFTTKDGLTDNLVLSAFQDHEGNIWVGTISGLERFRRRALVPVTLPKLYPDSALAPGKSGDIWAFLGSDLFHISKSKIEEIDYSGDMLGGNYDSGGVIWLISREPALVRFENGSYSRSPLPRELPNPFSKGVRITEDHSGVLWMAVEQQGLFRREKGTWSRFDTSPELSQQTPTDAFTDSLGRAWFAYDDGTIIYLAGGKIHTVSTRQNSPVAGVGTIQGRNKHVWVGGFGGLALFDGDKFHSVIPVDRPGFAHVSGIAELDDGSLWLCEQRGVIHINAPEVHKFLETPSYRVHYKVFDSLDGLPGIFNGVEKLAVGTDGRIWFKADHGIAWLDPARIPPNVPPPISIRSLTANGKKFEVQPYLTLPPRSGNLRIEYTALNLSVPERVRYRCKLDGLDRDWQDAGNRREAFYTNLGPGNYRFHISTREEGGPWNIEESVLDFRIAPAWFQTVWFRAFCVCVFLFLLWMLYQLRLRQLERQFNRTLEARVSERTRIARELHDTLLQTFSASLLRLQSVSKMLPTRPDEAKQRVDSTIEQASNAIAEGRDAVHQLRSDALTTTDLGQSISDFASELMSSSSGENSPEFHVQVEGTPRNLNPMVRDEAYRIAAEALRNATRYAGARQIEVEIRYDEQQLRLRIRDNGKGIDPGVLERGHAPGHWGLRGMRERAKVLGGNLEVWSEVGSGTEIELTVPAASAYAQPASRWPVLLKGWRNWLMSSGRI